MLNDSRPYSTDTVKSQTPGKKKYHSLGGGFAAAEHQVPQINCFLCDRGIRQFRLNDHILATWKQTKHSDQMPK